MKKDNTILIPMLHHNFPRPQQRDVDVEFGFNV